MPWINDKSEKEAKRLLKQGYATVGELLAASFGEWPPKGLDINPAVTHGQKVDFKPFMEGFEARHGVFSRISERTSTMGRASLAGERYIRINRLLCTALPRLAGRSDLAQVMGHEAVHSLQGDNYYRAAEIFGTEQGAKIRQNQPLPTSTMIMGHLAAVQESFPQGKLTKAFRSVTRLVRPSLKYLSGGVETQAFLHDAITTGYRRWGRLPVDRKELWQAMVGFGLTPPKEVKAWLSALPADDPSRLFRSSPMGEGGRNLNAIEQSLSKKARAVFWEITMPAIYSDLIEMYGDLPGRARFGFGPNTKASPQPHRPKI